MPYDTGISQEYYQEMLKIIKRLSGGVPGHPFPNNPRHGLIVRALIEAANTISKDIYKYTRNKQFNAVSEKYFIQQNARLIRKIQDTLKAVNNQITSDIEAAITSSWDLANDKNSKLLAHYSKNIAIPTAVYQSMNQLNHHALQAFLGRVENGMNLSERVWNFTVAGNQEKLEQYLASGIMTGRSADNISRDVRQLLREPNKLFRRVRDPKTGKLVLSKAAKLYHPGQGVYRSSYKNARRLAATETNMSYRRSDHIRRKQLPFVIGVIVRLSRAHKIEDICDDMAGEYPVDFQFYGWHPHCICYTTSKRITKEEFKYYIETGKIDQRKVVKSIPQNAQNYVDKNLKKINRLKSTPYWFEDNFTAKGKVKNSVHT